MLIRVKQHWVIMCTAKEKDNLVEIRNLVKHFPIRKGLMHRLVGTTRAVDGVDLKIRRGETLGLVGESGCGKTTLGRTLACLYQPTAGEIIFSGQDILKLGKRELQKVRRKMQMIFQDPFASMNPRMRVKEIVAEPLVIHKETHKDNGANRIAQLIGLVGLQPECLERFPHEFSGGQRQRIAVARAIALNPDFIICDEPVSALDVSIRAQIINLFERLQAELDLTYLFISHDLAVVRHISERVAVMYLGKIVETADRIDIYNKPLHPYTKALLSAIPIPDPVAERARVRTDLKGDIPSPSAPPSGCRFHTRCEIAEFPRCNTTEPEYRELSTGHWVACHLH